MIFMFALQRCGTGEAAGSVYTYIYIYIHTYIHIHIYIYISLRPTMVNTKTLASFYVAYRLRVHVDILTTVPVPLVPVLDGFAS